MNWHYTFGQSYLFSSFSLILAILADSFILFSTLAFALIFSLLPQLLPLVLLPLLFPLVLLPLLLPIIFAIPILFVPISSIRLFSSLSITLLLATKRSLTPFAIILFSFCFN